VRLNGITVTLQADMERILLNTAPSYFWRKLAVALAVGFGAGTALLRLHLFPAAWIVMGLCGLYALLQLRALGEDQERLVIDDAGIRDSMLPVGLIGWDEVRGASVQKVGSVEVIALQLRDPERVIRRLPPARQFIARNAVGAGLPGIYLTLVGTEGDPAKIAALINRKVEGQGSRAEGERSEVEGRRSG
jgi:hypothetical protein